MISFHDLTVRKEHASRPIILLVFFIAFVIAVAHVSFSAPNAFGRLTTGFGTPASNGIREHRDIQELPVSIRPPDHRIRRRPFS